jgi:hypothetical protein
LIRSASSAAAFSQLTVLVAGSAPAGGSACGERRADLCHGVPLID